MSTMISLSYGAPPKEVSVVVKSDQTKRHVGTVVLEPSQRSTKYDLCCLQDEIMDKMSENQQGESKQPAFDRSFGMLSGEFNC